MNVNGKLEQMRWFGPILFSNACIDLQKVDVPTGIPCSRCNEVIEPTDCGYMVNHITQNEISQKPIHEDCFMREVVGSVGHQMKKCHCYGGNEDDPPELTKRQAATAAVKLFYQRARIVVQ